MIKGDLNITSTFTKKLAKITQMKVDISYITQAGLLDPSAVKSKIEIAKNVKLTDLREILYQENAIFKNSDQSKKRENVFFAWSRNNLAFNVAFVDDILEVDTFQKKNHLCVVQTSEKKFQTFFLLDRYVNANELYKIQKVLQTVYRGDVGALAALQPKRLPGFLNNKYDYCFIVKDVFWGDNKIDADKILNYYHTVIEKPQKINNTTINREKTKTTATKSWKDFAKTTDRSQTDIRYVCYLVAKNYNDQEIREMLLKESENIINRKRNLDDYVRRTIEKARRFVS